MTPFLYSHTTFFTFLFARDWEEEERKRSTIGWHMTTTDPSYAPGLVVVRIHACLHGRVDPYGKITRGGGGLRKNDFVLSVDEKEFASSDALDDAERSVRVLRLTWWRRCCVRTRAVLVNAASRVRSGRARPTPRSESLIHVAHSEHHHSHRRVCEEDVDSDVSKHELASCGQSSRKDDDDKEACDVPLL